MECSAEEEADPEATSPPAEGEVLSVSFGKVKVCPIAIKTGQVMKVHGIRFKEQSSKMAVTTFFVPSFVLKLS